MGRWWPAGLLLLVALFGWLAVALAPADTHAEFFPAGVAAAMLLVAGRRAWLYLLLLAPVAFVATVAGGRPVDVAAAGAVAVSVEAAAVWFVLTSRGHARAALRTFGDLDRYAVAAVAGASTATVLAYGTAVLTGYGEPTLTALATGSSHLASLLVVLPFFLRPVVERATAQRWEQVLAWLAVLGVTPLVFLVDSLPALGFLVMPLLVWGALRLGTWQSLTQVLVVVVIASSLAAAGYGPITWVSPALEGRADAATVLLQVFNVGCVLVVVPLVLMTGLRRASERQAAAERDRLARVVEAATGVAIIGTSSRGLVTLFNPGAERLLGWAREEILGLPAHVLMTDDAIREKAEEIGVRNDFAALALRLTQPDQADSLVRLRRRGGEERAHLLTLSQVVDDRGRVAGFVGTSEDVTDQVRTQEAMERALHRMKEVDSLKDAFISTVSHELRTPVTSIVGYLELLADGHFGALADAQVEAIGRVERNSERLLVLIDDLLTLARMQDAADPVEAGAAVDLAEIVRRGTEVTAPQAEASEVALAFEPPGSPVWVHGDADALEGVVINLVGNAVKYTPGGGAVDVRLGTRDGHALLTVTDTGIGIPEEEIDLLFTRFYRSSVTLDRAIPGSGLGLSIAHGVVQSHDGRIQVESEVGRGTTFSVLLPLADLDR